MQYKSTRARFLAADDLDTLFIALEALPFRVEFKDLVSDPVKGGWIQTFILPDTEGIVWESLDLRGLT